MLRRAVISWLVTSVAMLLMILSMGDSFGDLGIASLPIAAVAGLLVVAVAYALGRPLSARSTAARWWAARPWLSWAAIGVGLAAFVLSRAAFATYDFWQDSDGVSITPQPVLAWAGLVLLAFGLLYFEGRSALPDESRGLDGVPRDR